MSIFFDRFSALCRQHGETPNAVARKIEIPSGSVTAWKRGAMPRPATLDRLGGYFGVTVDYLLGKEAAPQPPDERPISDRDLKFALWGETSEIDDGDLEDVRRYAAFLAERKKRRE